MISGPHGTLMNHPRTVFNKFWLDNAIIRNTQFAVAISRFICIMYITQMTYVKSRKNSCRDKLFKMNFSTSIFKALVINMFSVEKVKRLIFFVRISKKWIWVDIVTRRYLFLIKYIILNASIVIICTKYYKSYFNMKKKQPSKMFLLAFRNTKNKTTEIIMKSVLLNI